MDVVDGVIMKKLSLVVARAIQLSFTSKFTLDAAKNDVLILELFEKITFGEIRSILTGSEVDASSANADRDLDVMLCMCDAVVCSQHSELNHKHDTCHVFITNTTHCSPGYTKLVPVILKSDKLDTFECSIKDMLVSDSNDKELYLSSEKIGDFIVTDHNKRAKSTHKAFRHGPCASWDVFEPLMKPVNKLDVTFGIPLCYWPPAANEWLTRERTHGWPNKLLIDKIQRLPCHVVPVGDRFSDNRNIQWRVSFVLGERELLWSFNNTQLHCLLVLKHLLSVIKHRLPEELSSYEIKNILFWQIEKTDATFWCEDNLLHGIKMCLISFRVCVLKGELWHYIDRKRNLLRNKLQDEKMRAIVVDQIDVFLNNIFNSVLFNLKEYTLIEIWKDSGQNMERFLEWCNQIYFTKTAADGKVLKDFHDQNFILFTTIIKIIYYPFRSNSITGMLHALNDTAKQLNAFELNTEINTYNTRVISDVLRIRLGINLYKYFLQVTSSESLAKGILLSVSHRVLSSAVDLDGMSGKLYLATFYLMTKDYYNSKYLIDSALYGRNTDLIYIGGRSSSQGIRAKTNGDAYMLKHCTRNEQCQYTRSDVAFDVMFRYDEIAFVPFALKYECIARQKVDYVSVHPLEYALYLAFCNRHQQQDDVGSKKCLNDLQKVVQENCVNHTLAWNLLGHCYSEVGDFLQALACYIKSLEQTTPGEYSNAALYHVIILIYKTKYWSNKERCSSSENYEVLYSRE